MRPSYVVVPLGVVALSAATVVLAGPLGAPGSAAPRASAAASAAPSASSAASSSAAGGRPSPPVPPRLIAKGDILETESAAPKLSEWGSGKVVRMDVNSRPGECKATLVREWVQIDCQKEDWGRRPGGGIRQIAGDPKGVGVFVSSGNPGAEGKDANVVMPLRRGDHRVFQLFDIETGGYGSASAVVGPVLEERWLEGEDRPTLVLR